MPVDNAPAGLFPSLLPIKQPTPRETSVTNRIGPPFSAGFCSRMSIFHHLLYTMRDISGDRPAAGPWGTTIRKPSRYCIPHLVGTCGTLNGKKIPKGGRFTGVNLFFSETGCPAAESVVQRIDRCSNNAATISLDLYGMIDEVDNEKTRSNHNPAFDRVLGSFCPGHFLFEQYGSRELFQEIFLRGVEQSHLGRFVCVRGADRRLWDGPGEERRFLCDSWRLRNPPTSTMWSDCLSICTASSSKPTRNPTLLPRSLITSWLQFPWDQISDLVPSPLSRSSWTTSILAPITMFIMILGSSARILVRNWRRADF